MSEMKHTKGPWEFDDEYPESMPSERYRINEASTGNAIAMVLGTADNLRLGQRDANARLIAAAPELLETLAMSVVALEECMEELGAGPLSGLGVFVQKSRALIAKATGGAQ